MNRIVCPITLAVLALFLVDTTSASIAYGGGKGDTASAFSRDDVMVRAARIADRGLKYLSSQQGEDRSFSVASGEDAKRAPLAVTALSALAFMAGGSTMGRGPYREQVRTAIEYLLDHQVDKPPENREDGVLFGYFTVDSDQTSKMHGHGFATLAVAQAYGTLNFNPAFGDSAGSKARDDQKRMHGALVAAVNLIERSQDSNTGGWYYNPYDAGHEGSMTVLMIQALRAARNVGIDVDRTVVDRAIRYIHRSQRPEDGAFRYQLNHQQVSYALTAAAVATLNASGDYDSTIIDLGIKYMKRKDPLLNADQWAVTENFPYYSRLYAAQAYHVYRDPRLWNEWYPRMVDHLEDVQNPSNGCFVGGDYGKIYSTGMSCLVLQVPFQYLPIFQK